jgi:rhodanese-related sulfurtransferase
VNFKNKTAFIFITAFCLLYQGCLKDNEVESPEFSFNQAEEILHYLENSGDFINSANCPAVIDADELYNNLDNYFIIDIRPAEEFNNGHVKGSLNIPHGDLFKALDTLDYQKYPKVVIISLNGQASAYYTSLLRIAGYDNIYSLYYGLAAWNMDFSAEWLQSLYTMEQIDEFTTDDYDKNEVTSLPEVHYNSKLSIEGKIKERAETLSKIEYSENPEIQSDNFVSIGITPFINRLHNQNDYLVCLTINDGYMYILGPREVFMHLKAAVHYMPPAYSDFRSTGSLQTIPKNRKTIIYSYDGVLSAFFTAYLNFLGYDTASLLYGLNAFSYDFLAVIPTLNKYYFNSSLIRSYPYVK